MARPIAIYVLYSTAIGIRQLVWSNAYNGTIFGVEVGEAFVDDAALGSNDVGEAEAPPKKRARVLP